MDVVLIAGTDKDVRANGIEKQEYLLGEISGTTLLYDPGSNARENELRQRLKKLWDEKYGY